MNTSKRAVQKHPLMSHKQWKASISQVWRIAISRNLQQLKYSQVHTLFENGLAVSWTALV